MHSVKCGYIWNTPVLDTAESPVLLTLYLCFTVAEIKTSI